VLRKCFNLLWTKWQHIREVDTKTVKRILQSHHHLRLKVIPWLVVESVLEIMKNSYPCNLFTKRKTNKKYG